MVTRTGPSGSGCGRNCRRSTPAPHTREMRFEDTPRDSTNRALSGFCTIVCDRERRRAQPRAGRRNGLTRRVFVFRAISAVPSPVNALTVTGTRARTAAAEPSTIGWTAT